jgi:hypothetical protein
MGNQYHAINAGKVSPTVTRELKSNPKKVNLNLRSAAKSETCHVVVSKHNVSHYMFELIIACHIVATRGNLTMVDKKTKKLIKAKISVEVLTAQRDHYRAHADFLDKQLAKAEARAELAEQRLHQITMTMAEISQNAISTSTQSSTTEVLMEGRSVLRLTNPVA